MRGAFHDLVVFFAGKRCWITLTTHKSRYTGSISNRSPATIIKFHADKHIARKYLFIAFHTTSAFFDFRHGFRRNFNSEHIVFETHSFNASLKIFLHFVLVSRVRVKDIPFLRHGLSPQTRNSHKNRGYYPIVKNDNKYTEEQERHDYHAGPLQNFLLSRPGNTTHFRTNFRKESKALLLRLFRSLLWLRSRLGRCLDGLCRSLLETEAFLCWLLLNYRSSLSLLSCALFFSCTIGRRFCSLCFRLLCHTTFLLWKLLLYTPNKQPMSCSLTSWQARRDSNPQHAVLETAALPIGATGLCLFLP